MKKNLGAYQRRTTINPIRLLAETPTPNAEHDSRHLTSLIPQPRFQLRRRSSSESRLSLKVTTLHRAKSTVELTTPDTISKHSKRFTQQQDCPSTSRNCVPFENKIWQNETCKKIESFLYDTQIIEAGKSLKAIMTTNIFIHICNQLLTHLDPGFSITKANYIEQLPLILKKLGYPFPLAKSFLISVNIPRNFGQVLAILDGLIDVVQKIDLYTVEDDLYIETVGKAYCAWLNNEDNACSVYAEELYNELAVEHQTESLRLQEQKTFLEEKLKASEEKMLKFKNEKIAAIEQQENLSSKIKKNEILQEAITEKTKEIKNLKTALANSEYKKAELETEIQRIQTIIKNQGFTMDEYKSKINECNEIQEKFKLQLNMINDNEVLQDKYTRELNDAKLMVSQAIKKFSCEYIQLAVTFPEFQKLSLPKFTSLTEPETMEVLEEMQIEYQKKLKATEASLNEIHKNLEQKTEAYEELIKKYELVVKQTNEKHSGIESVVQENKTLLNLLKMKKEELELKKNYLLTKLNEPLVLPDINAVKKQIVDIEKKENFVKNKIGEVKKDHAKIMTAAEKLQNRFLGEFNASLDDIVSISARYNAKMNSLLSD